MRLDKWLWAARFYKTRSIASDEISKNRVRVNGQSVKTSREVKAGDMVCLLQGTMERTVHVLAVSAVRGPAPVAQGLYEETQESLQTRQKIAEFQRLAREPALSIGSGRPSKRDRRQMDAVQGACKRASLD